MRLIANAPLFPGYLISWSPMKVAFKLLTSFPMNYDFFLPKCDVFRNTSIEGSWIYEYLCVWINACHQKIKNVEYIFFLAIQSISCSKIFIAIKMNIHCISFELICLLLQCMSCLMESLTQILLGLERVYYFWRIAALSHLLKRVVPVWTYLFSGVDHNLICLLYTSPSPRD